jgi:hypothetical protein
MNSEYIQNLRYKLQKRVRRLNSVDSQLFQFSLKNFWGFLQSYPTFQGILEDLERRCPHVQSEIDKISHTYQYIGDSELEEAASGFFMIRKCIASDNDHYAIFIGHTYNRGATTDRDASDTFRSIFLEPFYEYLDEQLDDQRSVLALLRRYKHKCEWFQSEALYKLWASDTQRGEKILAFHLYEYLHDQGIDFNIEPASAVGEADLVAAQNSTDPLIADTKIFNPDKSKGKPYIARGFHQIYLYTLTYNEPFGYLIVYNTYGKDLRFALVERSQTIPFVIHNNKTIFIIVIDIFPHEQSASQRGNLETIEITEQELIQFIEEHKPDDINNMSAATSTPS